MLSTRTTLSKRMRLLTLTALAMLTLALIACASENDPGNTPAGPTTAANVETTPASGNGDEAPATGSDAGGDGAMMLTMADIAFGQTELTIAANQAAQFEVTNEGALEHDFTIEQAPVEAEASGDLGSDPGDVAVRVVAAPGASGQMTLTASEAGEYTFYCSVPGHREAGMEGTLIVE